MTQQQRSPGEMVSLGERMGYLQALRAALALIVLVSGVVAQNVVGAGLEDLLLVSVGYLMVSATGEGLRRAGRMRGLLTVGGMLLIDGLFLAWVLYLTGGTQSPLRFLVYVHLIAVTLLASYRTGLKIALWHSLLFFVVFYAQVSGIVPQLDSTAEATTRPSVFNVVAFWVVALATTAFSSINERELRRRKADVEALAGMAARLEPQNLPREVAEELMRSVCSTFELSRGVVAGGQGGVVEMLAYQGPGETPVVGSCTGGLVQRAIEERRPILAKAVEADDEWLNRVLPFARNLVAVPLSADGEAVGALVVEHGDGRGGRVERRVVSMLGQFAAHAALALKNSWLLQQVQRLAETDGLTGLANRRTFETTLERELSRAARSGEPVTLVMVDVDHFKKLNDTFGHQAGDEVLELVAGVLASACRDFDTAARYGGEEFVVILPACSSAESLVVAERLRESIAAIDTVTKVTASAGVATFPAHASDPEGLINAADEALYESKRAGRNRVTRSRRRGARKPKLLTLPE